ncbi:MAG: hypothetical protein ACR2JF_07340 [Iamia sp.]
MALPSESLTSEQRAHQAALDRTWEGAQRALADPERRAHLEAAVARLRSGPRPVGAERAELLTELARLTD